MNFRELDFHINASHTKVSVTRQHRSRINHMVDSIYLRTPKGLTTELFSKLNVCVNDFSAKTRFWHFERIGYVEYFDPEAHQLLRLPQQEAVALTRRYLLRGIMAAARHDRKFAEHLPVLRQLIKTAHQTYDYRTHVVRSSQDRRMRAELILRIQPDEYLWDIEVMSKQGIERLTINRTTPLFPYFTRFKLKWIGGEIQLFDQADKMLGRAIPTVARS